MAGVMTGVDRQVAASLCPCNPIAGEGVDRSNPSGARLTIGIVALISLLALISTAVPTYADEPIMAYLRVNTSEAGKDVLPGFRRFGLFAGQGPLNYAVETRPVRLIGLDSSIPGRVEGALPPATLSFLEDALACASKVPTLLFFHHPPMMIGIDGKDDIRLGEGADELAAILSRHPQVERVVVGHFHRSFQARFGGAICQGAPPVRYMTVAERGDADEHELDEELPGYLIHRWIESVGLVSHVCPIPLTD